MRKKTFFLIGHTLIEMKNETTTITLKKIMQERAKKEDKEYKQLQNKFNEEQFDIAKVYDKWIVKEKE